MKESTLPPVSLKKNQVNDKYASLLLRNVRLTFVSLDKPKPSLTLDANGNPVDHQYEATILIPKKSKVKDELLKIIQESVKLSKNFADTPRKDKKNKPLPSQRQEAMEKAMTIGGEGATLKDGDEEISRSTEKPYDGNEGNFLLKVKAKAVQQEDGTFKPKQNLTFVRVDMSEIRRHEISSEIYSGVWADVSLSLVPYNWRGNVGVTAYLNGIQKLIDDVKLGGANPFDDRSEEFTATEAQSEEVEDY